MVLPPRGEKVAVAASGGVDSSYVIAALLDAGCSVEAVSFDASGASAALGGVDFSLHPSFCFSPRIKDKFLQCKEMCNHFGVKYTVIDLSSSFLSEVLDYYRSEYQSQRTPNPCLVCNPIIKFGAFKDAALKMTGATWFATGHYSRIVDTLGQKSLMVAVDENKDQSYFLSRLEGKHLNNVCFPLGELYKSSVVEAAKERGIKASLDRESQDFLPKSLKKEVFQSKGLTQGNFISPSGKVLCPHDGRELYTLGQRRGTIWAAGEARYVKGFKGNDVILDEKENLYSSTITASNFVWHPLAIEEARAKESQLEKGEGTAECAPIKAWVKIRSRNKPTLAHLFPVKKGTWKIDFSSPQWAPTPGQAAVGYTEDGVVLFSSIIE